MTTFPGAPIPSDPAKLPQLPGHKNLAKLYPSQPGTILDWGIKKGWPTWLVCALQEGRPVNKIYAEQELEELARQMAGLPLGRKQPYEAQLSGPPEASPAPQEEQAQEEPATSPAAPAEDIEDEREEETP